MNSQLKARACQTRSEICFFSSPEPSVGELWRPSVRRRLLTIHLVNQSQSSCEAETNSCINGPGHMTKIAAMPIYNK